MKLVIDVPEEFYRMCKKWKRERVANFTESIIAEGKPLSQVQAAKLRVLAEALVEITDKEGSSYGYDEACNLADEIMEEDRNNE